MKFRELCQLSSLTTHHLSVLRKYLGGFFRGCMIVNLNWKIIRTTLAILENTVFSFKLRCLQVYPWSGPVDCLDYVIDRFDLYDPRKSYIPVDHSLRIRFTLKIVLAEVVPPPENFPLLAYTALPFSMLLHRIDRNILLCGENVTALVLGLFYCVICILNTMCFMLW
jgi:hypothetical protein